MASLSADLRLTKSTRLVELGLVTACGDRFPTDSISSTHNQGWMASLGADLRLTKSTWRIELGSIASCVGTDIVLAQHAQSRLDGVSLGAAKRLPIML